MVESGPGLQLFCLTAIATIGGFLRLTGFQDRLSLPAITQNELM